ncbi:MAG: hypothetical protein IKR73_05475 [Oscillospiraceae bacterium]|nr:hypothetical protein [Oscillospiraceae bacterium]
MKKTVFKHIKRILITAIVLVLVVVLALFAYINALRTFLTAPVRIDSLGKLYYIEYTGELTSLTQYSAVYHNSDKSVDICVYPDYSEVYRFSVP